MRRLAATHMLPVPELQQATVHVLSSFARMLGAWTRFELQVPVGADTRTG